jgi:hypothetical protein
MYIERTRNWHGRWGNGLGARLAHDQGLGVGVDKKMSGCCCTQSFLTPPQKEIHDRECKDDENNCTNDSARNCTRV